MEPNVFRENIVRGKITSEADLKRLFRNLALKLHPDTSLDAETAEQFLRMKREYDEALCERGWAAVPTGPAGQFDPVVCVELFGELIAGNFPADRRVKALNKLYRSRVSRLDELISRLGGRFVGLFARVERELQELRGDGVIDNHEFNLTKIYLCNLYDSLFSRHLFSNNYIRTTYPQIEGILNENNCPETVRFIDLMRDLGKRPA